MEIIPAIDIRGGRCVRLYQGDFARETIFADDPVAVARSWQEAGAPRLHVVDLDGAREGWPVNAATVRRIIRAVSIPVQVGGGLRNRQSIERYLQAGADRIVLGTAAVKDRSLLAEAVAEHGQHIAVSVDAKVGVVAIEGWQEDTSLAAAQLIAELSDLGVPRFVYTDVLRDGTLSQPNFDAVQSLLETVAVPIIYAGGVADVEHLVRLASLGVEGTIIGQALYTGSLQLQAALAAVRARSR